MNILERAFVLSAYINAANAPVSPRELADALDIPLSTIYRLTAQLKSWGYVCDSVQSGHLTSGPLFLQNYQRYALFAHVAREGLRELARHTRETVALITATPVQTVCVDMVESTQRLRCSFAVGEAQSPVRGCSAKTILAFRDSNERDAIIARHLATPHERDHLRSELQAIKHAGFGQSSGEVDAGIWGVSAPILKKQQLLGVMTVMVPVHRAQEADFFTAQVVDCARRINELVTLHH